MESFLGRKGFWWSQQAPQYPRLQKIWCTSPRTFGNNNRWRRSK